MTLAEQIACVEREIGFRERCYPGWVRGHKLTQAKADHELGAMRAVLETLRSVERIAFCAANHGPVTIVPGEPAQAPLAFVEADGR